MDRKREVVYDSSYAATRATTSARQSLQEAERAERSLQLRQVCPFCEAAEREYETWRRTPVQAVDRW